MTFIFTRTMEKKKGKKKRLHVGSEVKCARQDKTQATAAKFILNLLYKYMFSFFFFFLQLTMQREMHGNVETMSSPSLSRSRRAAVRRRPRGS